MLKFLNLTSTSLVLTSAYNVQNIYLAELLISNRIQFHKRLHQQRTAHKVTSPPSQRPQNSETKSDSQNRS
ncbi:hypothetical protein phiMH2Kp05 [Bdellovibrio phage phiMH2K]|uniref:Uncharacterized protein X n=1 Tax=Bdellovibrio phage phiMH2K TaxID=145579 RepID=X_BPPHM|nr:hypothetical protein phiMH2Kp05 [Bdellovibrio phage phiMH2K]Q9G056.1 RecName: Full=Uncharacterized protein X [Bdellovibrio phage phiMH2K]AAG45343.1 OrfX [Bdellovibrio phage phiMH2K]